MLPVAYPGLRRAVRAAPAAVHHQLTEPPAHHVRTSGVRRGADPALVRTTRLVLPDFVFALLCSMGRWWLPLERGSRFDLVRMECCCKVWSEWVQRPRRVRPKLLESVFSREKCRTYRD